LHLYHGQFLCFHPCGIDTEHGFLHHSRPHPVWIHVLEGWLHRRIGRGSLIPLMGVLLLAGCTSAPPSSNTSLNGSETSTHVSTSWEGSPTDSGPSGSVDAGDCVLDDSPSRAMVTRWSTPSPSTWWVTYDVVTNNCLSSVTLTGIALVGPERGGDGVVDLGSVQAVPVSESTPPNLYTSEDTPPLEGVGLPIVLASRSSTSIAVRITLPRLGSEPSRIPKLRLSYVSGSHEHILEMNQDLRFCSCAPPTSPPAS
jgi:hypothetical protein